MKVHVNAYSWNNVYSYNYLVSSKWLDANKNVRVTAYFWNNYYLYDNLPNICMTQDANDEGTCDCIFLK